jgi:hypothetical protein
MVTVKTYCINLVSMMIVVLALVVVVSMVVFWRFYPDSFSGGEFMDYGCFLLIYSGHSVVGISFYNITVLRCKISVISFLNHCHSF